MRDLAQHLFLFLPRYFDYFYVITIVSINDFIYIIGSSTNQFNIEGDTKRTGR